MADTDHAAAHPSDTPLVRRISPRRPDAILLVLILIVIVGAALRLHGLAAKSLWYDEAVMVQFGELDGLSWKFLDPDSIMEAPLPGVMVYLWRKATFADALPPTSPASDFMLRLLPAVLSIACIPLLYRVTTALLRDRPAGLIAAGLFAISPFHIYYAHELRSYAFTSVFGLLSLYFLLRVFETNAHRHHAALGVALLLMMYTHVTNVWTVVIMNIVALIAIVQKREILPRWVVYQAALVLLSLPVVRVAYHANNFFLSIPHTWSDRMAPTVKTALITFKTLFFGYGPTVWAYWPLLLLALIFSTLGIVRLRQNVRNALLLALLIVLPLAINVVFWRMRTLSLYEHRIFVFYGIVAIIAVTSGIRTLRHHALWSTAAIVAFVGFTLPGLRDVYAHRLHPVLEHRIAIFDKVDFRAAADYIREHWSDGDILTHDGLFTLAPMQHYLPISQVHLGSAEDANVYTTYVAPEPILRRHGQYPVPAEEATAGAQRVWLVEAFGLTFDDKPQSIAARDWLNQHFTRVDEVTFDGVRVYCYERR